MLASPALSSHVGTLASSSNRHKRTTLSVNRESASVVLKTRAPDLVWDKPLRDCRATRVPALLGTCLSLFQYRECFAQFVPLSRQY
eukprot:2864745-Rhodomonas_salina.2